MNCPHCQQKILDDSGHLAHFMSETQARTTGRGPLCDRGGKRIAKRDYWGWACGRGHTCYVCRLPAVPDGTND